MRLLCVLLLIIAPSAGLAQTVSLQSPTAAIAAQYGQSLPSVTEPEIDDALDAYIRIDRSALSSLTPANRAAVALLSVMDRQDDGSGQLMALAKDLLAGPQRNRLANIAIDQLIAEYRWNEVVNFATAVVPNSGAISFAQPYRNWPVAGIMSGKDDVIEVPFDGLYIPATLNGEAIRIALDTGAPSVGVHPRLIDLVQVDRSAPQTFALPAFELILTRYHALIGELAIGNVVLTNVPATVGAPVEESKLPAFQRMEQITGRHDIIMGLDALRPFFEVVEFDYNRDVVRLIIRDSEPPAVANMILGSGRIPMIRLKTEARAANVYVDTGSYGHLLGSGAFSADDCRAQRVMAAPWRELTEYRVNVAIADEHPVEVWAQPASAVTEPDLDLVGYVGNPRNGIYRLDLADGHFDFRDYDFSAVDSLWPIARQSPDSCILPQSHLPNAQAGSPQQ